MSGWELAGTILAIWFAASALIAFGWAAVGLTRKPAPQPPLSNEVVDRRFRLIVQDLRDESTEADR